METALWRDMAQFYHADLRNLAGPYDRSYGMDMRQYASVIGIWMRLALDKDRAPFPNTDHPFEHDHDIAFVPLIAYLGADVPSDALEHFRTFRGERQIDRTISDAPRRVVTAWLGKDRMIGAEFTSRSAPQSNQLHPATIHWRIGSDQVGWVRLLYLEPVDAHASRNRLEITTTSEIAFLVCAPGALGEQIELDSWRLPQLNVSIKTNAESMELEQREGMFEIRYQVATNQPITCTLDCE